MKLLFLAMQSYLLSLFTEARAVGTSQWLVNFIRVWNDQVKDLNDGNSVSEFALSDDAGHTPAIFIEFPDVIDWMQLGNGVQAIDDLRIKIHVLVQHLNPQSEADTSMEQNLDALAIAQTIYETFNDWMPSNMTIGGISVPIPVGVMNRIGDIQDKNHPAVYEFIQEYSTTWVDSSRMRPINGKLSGAIDLQVAIMTGTPEQNNQSTAIYYS